MATAAVATSPAPPDPAGSVPLRADICHRLNAEQIAWLEQRLASRPHMHALDYRVSTSIFGRRFYVILMAGRELRSAKRLQQQGLNRRFSQVAFEVAVFCLAATFMVAMIAGAGFGIFWLLDSSLGLTNLPEYLDKLFH